MCSADWDSLCRQPRFCGAMTNRASRRQQLDEDLEGVAGRHVEGAAAVEGPMARIHLAREDMIDDLRQQLLLLLHACPPWLVRGVRVLRGGEFDRGEHEPVDDVARSGGQVARRGERRRLAAAGDAQPALPARDDKPSGKVSFCTSIPV